MNYCAVKHIYLRDVFCFIFCLINDTRATLSESNLSLFRLLTYAQHMHMIEIREICYNLSAITKPEVNDSSKAQITF